MKNKCKLVRTLTSVKPFVVYQTKNHNLFHIMHFNRGEDKGIDENRVRDLMRTMIQGEFHFELSPIIVNKRGEIIDGNSRFVAMKRIGLPVYFRVVFEDKYNGEDGQTAIIMAQYNKANSTWGAKQQFRTAIKCGNPLAILLADYRAGAVAKLCGLKESEISPNLLMTMLARNPKKTHSTKRNFTEYYNPMFYEYAKTEQFKKEFAYICNVMAILKESSVDTNRVIEQVLALMWGNDEFNAPRFLYNLQYLDFNLSGKLTGKIIREKIMEIADTDYKVKKAVSIF